MFPLKRVLKIKEVEKTADSAATESSVTLLMTMSYDRRYLSEFCHGMKKTVLLGPHPSTQRLTPYPPSE